MTPPNNAASDTEGARAIVALVATRKGAWLFHSDSSRQRWRANGPHFLGHIVSHLVLGPRDGRTLLAAAGFGQVQSRTDLAGIARCSGAQWPTVK